MALTNKGIAFALNISAIVVCGLIFTAPILINGCLDAHDFNFHFVYSKYFSEQLWKGEFYPRWLQGMNAGFGSPTFFFYAPAPYYFTSLFSTASGYNLASCSALGLSSSLALVASGLTMYLWLQEIVPKYSAAIASIVYMAWPYHLFIDLYLRFAFAEYWSFVWMPLILYFSLKIVTGSRLYIIGLAISLALLALTHLPTFVIFFPIPVGYALFMSGWKHWKVTLFRLSLATIIAIGLSAIYWLPAMTTQASISMEAILTGKYHYANNFLFTGPKVEHDKRFWKQLEVLTILTGGLAFCAWKVSQRISQKASQRRSNITARKESHYWMTIAIISLFMTLPISKFAWDILPTVQRIQFPWRFNTLLTVAISCLIALAITQISPTKISQTRISPTQIPPLKISKVSLQENNHHLLSQALTLVGIVTTLTLVYVLPTQKFVFWKSNNTVLSISLLTFLLLIISLAKKPIAFHNHKFLSAGALIMLTILLGGIITNYEIVFLKRAEMTEAPAIEASLGASEHRPQWVPEGVFNANTLTQLNDSLPFIQVDSGNASWVIKQWQPRAIFLEVNATTASELTLHQFYYPGWTAQLMGSLDSLPINSLPINFSELGLLQISVPTGKNEVYLTLAPIAEEQIAQMISVASAACILLLCGSVFPSVFRKYP